MLDEKSIEIYSSRDKIREQLIDLAKDYLKLTNFDFAKSSYLSYIINMLATLDANLMYYISSVYREQFLTKAIQRESVLNLSNIIGYKPNFAKPSTCSVLIEIPFVLNRTTVNRSIIEFVGRNDDSTIDETERKVFRIYSNDGVEFSLIDTIVVEISTQKTIRVKQKMYINSSLTGYKDLEYRYVNGKIQFFANFIQLSDYIETFTIPEVLPNAFHNINYNFNKNGSIANVDIFTVSTSINNVLERWVHKESIFGIGPSERAFTYRETDNGIIITFGNGVVGKQPKKGTNVIVNVGLTKGFKGNVIAGSIRNADSITITEIVNNAYTYKKIEVNVINKEPSQFGENAPTIDEIRTNAINRVSTNSRLVSERDFQNADLVVQNLPVRNVFQVLKRSDLKRNEITIFTELIYNNVVVPTRNANLLVALTSEYKDSDAYLIKAEETEITIDDEVYITLFDIILNQYTNEVNYYYFINEIQKPVSIYRADTTEITKILPIYSYCSSRRTADPEELYLELHCSLIDTTSSYECEVTIEWAGSDSQKYILYDNTSLIDENVTGIKIFSTDKDDDDTTNGSSNLPILLEDIPAGNTVEFTFAIYKLNSSNERLTELNVSKNSLIIKKDLNDFMYSQVEPAGISDNYYIYDVPVIKKDYFNNLINKSLFTTNVLQKIVDFNVFEYKMITDYVNLKFANTTGYSTNMKYKSITRTAVIDINPSSDDVDLENGTFEVGDRYAVSDVKNIFSTNDTYKDSVNNTGGYIGTYVGGTTGWTFEKLKVNDIFDVLTLNGIEDNTYRMIYTGIEIVEPKFTIPVQIKLVIIPSDDSRVSDQVLIKNIKDTLVTKLNPYFGYNKTLLRSVIIKTVQEVSGVEHVELLDPSFNIKFETDPYKNMTQEDLLRYTPELIYFSTEDIIIELKDQ